MPRLTSTPRKVPLPFTTPPNINRAGRPAATAPSEKRRIRDNHVHDLDKRLPDILRGLRTRLTKPRPVGRRQRLALLDRDGAAGVCFVELRADLSPPGKFSLFRKRNECRWEHNIPGRAPRPGRCCSRLPRTTCPCSGSWLCWRCRRPAGRRGRRGRSLLIACGSVLGRPGVMLVSALSDRRSETSTYGVE